MVISAALANSLGKILSVPYMTLPFNLVAVLSFLVWDWDHQLPPAPQPPPSLAIDWTELARGVVLSMGQVYAVEGLTSSVLMWVAVLLYSPLLCLTSLAGAVVGSCLPLAVVGPASLPAVYRGLWGYSALLSLAGLSSAILPASRWSLLAGVINAVTTVLTQVTQSPHSLYCGIKKLRTRFNFTSFDQFGNPLNVCYCVDYAPGCPDCDARPGRPARVHPALHPLQPAGAARLAVPPRATAGEGETTRGEKTKDFPQSTDGAEEKE